MCFRSIGCAFQARPSLGSEVLVLRQGGSWEIFRPGDLAAMRQAMKECGGRDVVMEGQASSRRYVMAI